MLSDWIIERFLPDLPRLIWHARLAPTTARYAVAGDAVGWAAVGLIRGARKYDPRRGVKPLTFVFHWLRNALQEGIRAGAGHDTIRWPDEYRGGFNPDTLPRNVGSRVVGEGGEATTLADFAQSHDPEPGVVLADQIAAVRGRLTKIEWRVLYERWGVGRTLGDIGRGLGLSKERVRQISERAACKARGERDYSACKSAGRARVRAEGKDLVNATEAAALLFRSPETVRYWVETRKIPAAGKSPRGHTLVRFADAKAYSERVVHEGTRRPRGPRSTYMTVAKAAKRLRLTARTVRELCEAGKLKAVRDGVYNRYWLVSRKAVARRAKQAARRLASVTPEMFAESP
jgi:excisionase family DNA binding protein